ncbi:hypothetical protein [Hwanghaeella sp.]|uniref:hypothetical protein n=1 Tax=Hwanghaeella sp. TaxID=2605943 RepID=UPI003CCB9BE4
MRKLFAIGFACLALVAVAACTTAVDTGAGVAARLADEYCGIADPDLREVFLKRINAKTQRATIVPFDCGDEVEKPAEPEKVSIYGNGNSLEPGANRLDYRGRGDHRERDYGHVPDAGEEPGIERHLARSEYSRDQHREEPERGRRLIG